jgi:acyl-CoA thioester hydrolase
MLVGGEDFDKPYAGGFRGNTHRFAVRVYFEDTDVAGIVYYANYLRFMERARSDMLRSAGIDQRGAMERGEGVYAVADLSIKYRASAKLEDELVVVSTVDAVRGVSCVIHQRVMRGGEILTDAMVTAAFLSPDGRPKRQPRQWVEVFKRLQGEVV